MATIVTRTCLSVTLLKVQYLSCYSVVGGKGYISVELGAPCAVPPLQHD